MNKENKPKLQVQKLHPFPNTLYGVVDSVTGAVFHSEKSRYFCRKQLDENYDRFYQAALTEY